MTQTLSSPAPRGACPTLDTPMAVADGLLARFRPVAGFSPNQIAILAEAAERCGNGRIEVTARGGIQVRGLQAETTADFRTELEGAGIAVQGGVAIEHSPIAGHDPSEMADPRPLAAALRSVCEEAEAGGPLSPKLAIVLASGGQVPLDGLKADIRLTAATEGWTLELGHTPLGLLAEADVPGAVAVILTALQQLGPRARAEDLHAREIADRILGLVPDAAGSLSLSHQWLGPMGLAGDAPGLRIGLPFGQVRAWQLKELARVMEAHGVEQVRPAPDRTLILLGFEASNLKALSPALAAFGYWTRPDAPGSALTLCSGAEAGDKGIIHAPDLAQALYASGSALVDGSFHLHVSTCAKGCPHAGRPGIVLSGNDLFVYRSAQQKPFARLDPDAIEAGIVHLTNRIRDTRQDGETVLDSVGRLGAP